jgi:hypothetical protein
MMKMNETEKALGFRVRVRCNSCFRYSWVTVDAGYDVNHVVCGRCGQPNAVVTKLIEIKPERTDGRKCSGACQSSKSGDCDCSCGGKNHGICA